MTMTARRSILRANAVFLAVAAAGGLVTDIRGGFFGQGPLARLLDGAPGGAIGFFEAHGLALIFAVLLWGAEPSRRWHATGAAIHALLGGANLAFWPVFPAMDALALGYLTTALHGLFFVVQLAAAAGAEREPAALAVA